jgi:acetyltransferase-like isoleucine patch superfamily enzyme
MLDPLLLRLLRRMEHVSAANPSTRAEAELRQYAEVGPNTRLLPGSHIVNPREPSFLSIGDYSYILGEVAIIGMNGVCRIGHHCSLGLGSKIWAQESITIGNFVLIAHGVDIFDSNSHSLDFRERREDAFDVFERHRPIVTERVDSAPIVIEDDVWIGAKSTILKGVHIGRGAVIAAASLVSKDVAPFTLVAGNPARVVRQLEQP